jgi:hypothetical protein
MSVTSKIYIGGAGDVSIIDAVLAYTVISRVQRSGVEYNVVYTTPGSRQVRYVASEGRLTFLNPFSGDPSDTNDLSLEDIIVTYNL